MADIKQRIIARDETAAAYASATQRVQQYQGAVKGGASETKALERRAREVAPTMGQLDMALRGSSRGAIDLAANLGKISPQLTSIGSQFALAAAAAYAMKRGLDALGAVSAVKEAFGFDAERPAEKIDRDTKDMEAAIERRRKVRDASRDAMMSRAEREISNPVELSLARVRIDYVADTDAIKDSVEDAEKAVRKAEAELGKARKAAGNIQSEGDREKIRTAEADLARAEADAATAREVSVDKQSAAYDRFRTALQGVRKEFDKTQDSLAKADMEEKIAAAAEAAKRHAEYAERVSAAVAATVGPLRNRAVAREALQGDAGGAQALQQAQAAVANMQTLANNWNQRRDPDARAAARREEREFGRMENRIARAERAEQRGGPMARWQRELLQEQRALKLKADEEENARKAREQEQQLREAVAAKARGDMVSELKIMNRDLTRLLAAAGGD